jgi:hypothetical protein
MILRIRKESSPVVDVRVEVHSGTDVVDELETRIAAGELALSVGALSVSVREDTLVSDLSTVVLLHSESTKSAPVDVHK